MRSTLIFTLIGALIMLLSCVGGDNSGVAPINPNGDSELALLMRKMYDDAMTMKSEIEEGSKPEIGDTYQTMLTADATEPEKVATQAYRSFTDAYHKSLESLQEANLGEVSNEFNVMVQNCMNCHQAMCPGPMVKIEKLYL